MGNGEPVAGELPGDLDTARFVGAEGVRLARLGKASASNTDLPPLTGLTTTSMSTFLSLLIFPPLDCDEAIGGNQIQIELQIYRPRSGCRTCAFIQIFAR